MIFHIGSGRFGGGRFGANLGAGNRDANNPSSDQSSSSPSGNKTYSGGRLNLGDKSTSPLSAALQQSSPNIDHDLLREETFRRWREAAERVQRSVENSSNSKQADHANNQGANNHGANNSSSHPGIKIEEIKMDSMRAVEWPEPNATVTILNSMEAIPFTTSPDGTLRSETTADNSRLNIRRRSVPAAGSSELQHQTEMFYESNSQNSAHSSSPIGKLASSTARAISSRGLSATAKLAQFVSSGINAAAELIGNATQPNTLTRNSGIRSTGLSSSKVYGSKGQITKGQLAKGQGLNPKLATTFGNDSLSSNQNTTPHQLTVAHIIDESISPEELSGSFNTRDFSATGAQSSASPSQLIELVDLEPVTEGAFSEAYLGAQEIVAPNSPNIVASALARETYATVNRNLELAAERNQIEHSMLGSSLRSQTAQPQQGSASLAKTTMAESTMAETTLASDSQVKTPARVAAPSRPALQNISHPIQKKVVTFAERFSTTSGLAHPTKPNTAVQSSALTPLQSAPLQSAPLQSPPIQSRPIQAVPSHPVLAQSALEQSVANPLAGQQPQPAVAGPLLTEDIRRRFGTNIRSALGPGTIIEGTFSFDSPVCIEGTLLGEVCSNSVLIVGPQATVKATVKVGTLIVFGSVTGDVEAEDLVEIRSGGVLDGDMKTERIAVESGGWFSGKCIPTSPKKVLESRSQNLQAKAMQSETSSRAEESPKLASTVNSPKWSL